MSVCRFLCNVNDTRALIGICLLVTSYWCQIRNSWDGQAFTIAHIVIGLSPYIHSFICLRSKEAWARLSTRPPGLFRDGQPASCLDGVPVVCTRSCQQVAEPPQLARLRFYWHGSVPLYKHRGFQFSSPGDTCNWSRSTASFGRRCTKIQFKYCH